MYFVYIGINRTSKIGPDIYFEVNLCMVSSRGALSAAPAPGDRKIRDGALARGLAHNSRGPLGPPGESPRLSKLARGLFFTGKRLRTKKTPGKPPKPPKVPAAPFFVSFLVSRLPALQSIGHRPGIACTTREVGRNSSLLLTYSLSLFLFLAHARSEARTKPRLPPPRIIQSRVEAASILTTSYKEGRSFLSLVEMR